jgi:hypothetical protein
MIRQQQIFEIWVLPHGDHFNFWVALSLEALIGMAIL